MTNWDRAEMLMLVALCALNAFADGYTTTGVLFVTAFVLKTVTYAIQVTRS